MGREISINMNVTQPLVTVVIPVKNGGTRLRECLSAVFAQRTDFKFDVLCVDSGSKDDSLDVIREFRCRLLEIAPSSFGHGKTRNLAISLSQTPFIAMITQDAVPADENWLRLLIAPMREDEEVAGVFGRHLPHEGCMPSEAYMLDSHFKSFGTEVTKVKIGPGAEGWNHYKQYQSWYRFLSDNNAALRRSVWATIPYRDVEFLEDQLWATDILEAGYAKVYAPDACVRHSHNYPALTVLRRTFDETRYFREYCDPQGVVTLGSAAVRAVDQATTEIRKLFSDPALSPRERASWMMPTIARAVCQSAGAFLGDHYELFPDPLVRTISQHHGLKGDRRERGRRIPTRALITANWNATVKKHGALEAVTRAIKRISTAAESAAQTNWGWTLIHLRREGENLFRAPPPPPPPWWEHTQFRLADVEPPVAIQPRVTRKKGSRALTVNWVIPAFGKGGGGHMNIFRMVQKLEQRGHSQRVYVIDGWSLPQQASRMQSLVHEWFLPIKSPVRHLSGEMEPADICMATSWETAYAVRASISAPVRGYFIQDYEPQFHPMGSQSILAEATYRFGFKGITGGPWLAKIMREKYGMDVRYFMQGIEQDEYYPEIWQQPARRRVFAYMRPHTARRAFEIVALALKRITEAMPDVEVHIAGWDAPANQLPFEYISHGILNAAGLRALFSTCDVALCPSLTNYSIMPQELAACGCPVVEVDVESTRAVYPKGAVVLAPPSPKGLANAALGLLRDETYRREQIRRGFDYVRPLTWDAAADSVESALREFAGIAGSETKHVERARKKA